VTLDQLVVRDGVPIEIVREGEVPDGFEVREDELDIRTVEVRGASADVARVARVEAHVQIQPTSLDIDRELDLTPVDARGEPIPQVDVEPESVRVRISVLEDGARRPVPVRVVTTGDPAPGFELVSANVQPDLVTIEGDGQRVAATTRLDTLPISLTGATEGFERTVKLALPADVVTVGSDEVIVTVTLRPVTATRTFSAGVVASGARTDRTYALSTAEVLVTLGGAPPDLDRMEGRTFTVQAAVAGLAVGEHEVNLEADLPAGLTLVRIAPATVTVTVGTPPAASAPAAAP
jgi:YbbR domain-containing protein